VTGSHIKLIKWDNYWQTDASQIHQQHQANVKNINYKIIAEAAQKVIALQTGAVDIVPVITADNTTDFQPGGSHDKQFDVLKYKDNLTFMLEPNCDKSSKTGDINMRLAIFNAVDSAGCAASLGQGQAAPVYAVGNANFPDYDPDWDKMENYMTAKKPVDKSVVQGYLDKAGYKGEELVMLTQQGDQETIATAIQAMLLNYGIKTKIQTLDYATMDTTMKDPKNWDLWMCAWASNDYIVNVWQHAFDTSNTKTGLTQTFIDDKKWQEMLDTVRTQSGHTKENLAAYMKHMTDNAYAMGLCQGAVNLVYTSDIKFVSRTDKNQVIPGACCYIK
jgi:ABC-type transport system substrate-binding protein